MPTQCCYITTTCSITSRISDSLYFEIATRSNNTKLKYTAKICLFGFNVPKIKCKRNTLCFNTTSNLHTLICSTLDIAYIAIKSEANCTCEIH